VGKGRGEEGKGKEGRERESHLQFSLRDTTA